VKRASAEMDRIFEEMAGRSQRSRSEPSPFSEITDEDIDSLFSD